MTIAKSLLSVSTVLGLAIGGSSMAKDLAPGQYSLGGLQEICLQEGGTWYGTTFPGWGGQWLLSGTETVIFGNYASGEGNDSIIVGKTATWDEWRDDLSYSNFSTDDVTHVKKKCDPPAVPADEPRTNNPLEEK